VKGVTTPVRALALLVATVGLAGLLAGCGASSGQGVQPSAIASGQAPIDTYTDTQGGGAATTDAPVTEKHADRATTAELARVHVVAVGLGADGKYIAVHFRAPPKLARRWQAGMLYVVDEHTRGVYASVPVVPVVGALLGRPQSAGQIGYVMLINAPPLAAGATVTVVLGSFKQTHVRIQ